MAMITSSSRHFTRTMDYRLAGRSRRAAPRKDGIDLVAPGGPTVRRNPADRRGH